MHPSDAPAPLAAKQVLSGRYRMVSPIARGGMAEVWEGYDQVLSRPVAVKVLQRQYASDEVFLERFRREAIAAARLAHPGVVATFDAGSDGPTTYMVMELVRGRTLRERLAEQGVFPPALAMLIAYQIADALVHAHRAGIVHRDIKPANILLLEDGDDADVRVKVADFGIAKAAEGLGFDLTNTGMVLGTPRYLSPEQVEGYEPDARADLYALGVICFEMLTGRSPFGGETEMAMAIARLNRAAPRVRDLQPKVPAYVDAIVAELLATDPQRRTPTALALRQKLAEIRQRLDTSSPTENGLLPRAGALSNRWRNRRDGHSGRSNVVPGPAPTASDVLSAPLAQPPTVQPPTVQPPSVQPPALRAPVGQVPPSPTRSSATPSSEAGSAVAPHPSTPVPPAGPQAYREDYPGTLVDAPVPGRGAPGAPGAPGARWRGGPIDLTAPPPASPSPTAAQPAPRPQPAQPAPRPQPPVAVPRRPGPVAGPPVPPLAVPDYGVPRDPSAPASEPFSVRPGRRSGRAPGVVVAAVAVLALIVAALLLTSTNHNRRHGAGGGGVLSAIPISSVEVWIQYPQRTPDNPGEAHYAIDGNPKTEWVSDVYASPSFGGYGGEGLAMRLPSTATVRELHVTSYTQGWSASAYVADSDPATLSGWGSPTATQTDIAGDATFNLAGRQGSWVMLYMTNTGPTDQIGIAELSIT